MDGKASKPSLSILLGMPKKVVAEEEEGEADIGSDAEESARLLQSAIKSGTPKQVAQLLKVLFTELMGE